MNKNLLFSLIFLACNSFSCTSPPERISNSPSPTGTPNRKLHAEIVASIKRDDLSAVIAMVDKYRHDHGYSIVRLSEDMGQPFTPLLQVAVGCGCEKIVELFLKEPRINVDVVVLKTLPDGSYMQTTPLFSSVIQGHVGIAQRLLEAGACHGQFDREKNRTDLIALACENNRQEMVNFLSNFVQRARQNLHNSGK